MVRKDLEYAGELGLAGLMEALLPPRARRHHRTHPPTAAGVAACSLPAQGGRTRPKPAQHHAGAGSNDNRGRHCAARRGHSNPAIGPGCCGGSRDQPHRDRAQGTDSVHRYAQVCTGMLMAVTNRPLPAYAGAACACTTPTAHAGGRAGKRGGAHSRGPWVPSLLPSLQVTGTHKQHPQADAASQAGGVKCGVAPPSPESRVCAPVGAVPFARVEASARVRAEQLVGVLSWVLVA